MTTVNQFVLRTNTLHAKAAFFVTQRRRDIDLYRMMADCLKLCEDVEAAGAVEALAHRVVTEVTSGHNRRRYFEKNPDVYLVVGRAVFDNGTNGRTSGWRYTATLREAAKLGLNSAGLVDWLRENGGLNALFRTRPTDARKVTTRTLHLNQSVAVPKDGTITLTLRRCANGFYDVEKTA